MTSSRSLTVTCESQVAVTATFPLVHRCPHRDETDRGTATISWITHGYTFELHALAEWLSWFADKATSHEDLTETIRDLLTFDGGAGVRDVQVVTRWSTAGAEVVVSCSTSPTPPRPGCVTP